MSTIGWLFILAAVIIGRQVAAGRVLNTKEDLSDAFLAIVRGDSAGLTEVFSRTGDAATASVASDEGADLGPGTLAKVPANHSVVEAAVQLGAKAKGYRWASAGPDYYDCSGLMYRACQRVGYKGPRFTTATVLGQKGMTKVAAGVIGDMVLWPAGSGGVTGHIGVMTAADEFYSARSVASGIGFSKISTFRNAKPVYVRLTV
jgi:cell wall-associated NlpC family hydrolase